MMYLNVYDMAIWRRMLFIRRNVLRNFSMHVLRTFEDVTSIS